MNGIDKAIDVADGVGKLANLIGEKQPTVSNWRAKGYVPAAKCQRVHRALGGRVSMAELNPEAFGEPDA